MNKSPFSFLDSYESSQLIVQRAVTRELLRKPLGTTIAVLKNGEPVMVVITPRHRARWLKTLGHLKEPT